MATRTTELETGDQATAGAISRRSFLGAAALGAAAVAIPGAAESMVGTAGSRLGSLAGPQPIGLQLYTLRDLMQKDVIGTLRQVADIGYREVEFAGLFDKKPSQIAEWFKKDGRLTSPSSHIPLDRLKGNLQGVVDECQTLGNGFVVCPWIDPAMRKTADDWRRISQDFNKIGESLQRVGLRFAYHNHDFEFEPLGTEIGYDILLKECDPKFVKMEMDLFWITKGKHDPLAYFAKYPGRFPCVHVKDMAGTDKIVNVGEGHIDWQKIFAKRREAGIEHFFVENDNPTSPLTDIKVSYTYLARLGL